MGQQPALRKAAGQRGLGGADLRARQLQKSALHHFRGRIRAHPTFEQRRFIAIRVMPDDECAIALEKHRLRQLGQQTRPPFQRRLAQPGNQQFGAGGFGERREHRGRHPRGSLRARRVAALVQRDAMPGASQPPRNEASAQAAADHGKIGLLSAGIHRHAPGAHKALPVTVTYMMQKTEE
jgi:hypothetical protein